MNVRVSSRCILALITIGCANASFGGQPETPIPRSVAGDKGQYFLLESKKEGDITHVIHKRVGVDSTGYTKTDIDCTTMQFRVLGYSEESPSSITESPADWSGLVPGSSKSDLVNFVCKSKGLSNVVSARLTALENYGRKFASSSINNSFIYLKAIETVPNKYKIAFKTEDSSRFSIPGAANNPAAYNHNIRNTERWDEEFCTPELKALMKELKSDMVSGDLQNPEGKTQSMAICFGN